MADSDSRQPQDLDDPLDASSPTQIARTSEDMEYEPTTDEEEEAEESANDEGFLQRLLPEVEGADGMEGILLCYLIYDS